VAYAAPRATKGRLMIWLKGVAIVLAAAVLLLAALVWLGAWHWASATQALKTELQATRRLTSVTHFSSQDLQGLPAPVQRFFRAVLTEGQPIVTAAKIAHVGQFNLGQETDQWKPFKSQQWVQTQRPGFVWDGRIELWPGLNVCVHDAYVAGTGILHPALLGLVSLSQLRGEGELVL
jgi:hypothetical protein